MEPNRLWFFVFLIGALLSIIALLAGGILAYRLMKKTPLKSEDTWFTVALCGVAFLFLTGSTWGSISVTKDGLEFTKEAVAEAIEATEDAMASDALTRAELNGLVGLLQNQNTLGAGIAQGIRGRLTQANDSSRAALVRLREAKAFLGPMYNSRSLTTRPNGGD